MNFLQELDPTKGKYVSLTRGHVITKIIAQSDDKEEVIMKAKLKGVQPPILFMTIDALIEHQRVRENKDSGLLDRFRGSWGK